VSFKAMENGYAPEQWRTQVEELRLLVNELKSRDIRVLFIRMPSSDVYAEWEEQNYPRKLYWDQLQAEFGEDALHFKDHAGMAKFVPVDGKIIHDC
ncbi:hypothetical protein OAU50_07625, partial [Planctomycetota bacterium]|nr:hypothetical protein [Planctomycetota bacterium]